MNKLSRNVLFAAMACLIAALPSMAADKLPKLVDLGAKKCIPCKKMAPILEQLKTEYAGRFDVEFIDVWQPENAKKAEQYAINLIPTQIFLAADGKELWRHEGYISKEDILKKWKELGIDLKAEKGATKREKPSTKSGTNE